MSRSSFLAEYLDSGGSPTAGTLHEVAHVVSAAVTINLVAGTLHETAHVVAANPLINLTASTLHVVAHLQAAEVGTTLSASSLHETAHPVSATVPINLPASTRHVVGHIVAASAPVSLTAGTLHARFHAVQAAVPNTVNASTLHITAHLIPSRFGYGVVRAIVVPLSRSDPYNPTYEMDVAETPEIAAALMEGSPLGSEGPQMSGATATFSMYELGGEELFTRDAVIDDADARKVHYQMEPGDTDEAGTFLARFHVEYVNGSTQDFPEDRYIEILVGS